MVTKNLITGILLGVTFHVHGHPAFDVVYNPFFWTWGVWSFVLYQTKPE